MNYSEKVIEYCNSNRVSTTEVADALGKSGVLERVNPINPDHFCVGRVRTIFAAYNSNYTVHEQIREVQKGEVVIIFAHECEGRAIIGDLVCKYLLLYKGAAAVVVKGLVRDAARLRRERYAVWAEGVTPLGCYNAPGELFPEEIEMQLRKSYEHGVAICDDGGVTVIPEEMLDEGMLRLLQNIEMQEDIWFYCLDTLKWDTKKIVCDEAYFSEQNLFSSVHVKQLEELAKQKDTDD